MDRRTFLKGSAALGLAAPQLARPALAQGGKVLRFVPQANLANFDPIWGTQYVVRNAGTLVWDMLYGVDAQLKPQRQMVESEEVSGDKLTWTFRLRPGLKWHDGEPVLAKDVVASLTRWMARDPIGLMIRGIQDDLSRGPVPTLEFQKKQIRTFAAYKMNVYSPYYEHTLEYKKNPLIGPPGGTISQAEVKELVAYAAQYHIDVIPEQEAFGHLHHVLNHYQPEFVFYLAGADPYEGDRLGRLKLTISGLRTCTTVVPPPNRSSPLSATARRAPSRGSSAA